MTGTAGPRFVGSALAPFSHNWIGGNIAGLASFAMQLESYVPRIGEVVTALDRQVAMIVGDAGWQGQAASAFTTAWQADAVGATALATVINTAAQTCGQLASGLATIENALEGAARQVEAHGVQIGPDGQPVPEPLNATAESWRQAYLSFYSECTADATRARINAAAALQALYAKIAPPASPGGGSDGLQPGDYNTLGDYLRAFWALPTEYRKEVHESVEAQEALVTKAKQALAADRNALGRFTAGNKINDHLAGLRDSQTELAGLEKELDAAKAHEDLFAKGLDFSVHDIPAFSGKDLSGILGVAADTPFVDILSGGLGAFLGAQQDISDHVNSVAAYTGETGGSVAAIAAADGAAEDIGGALAVRLGVGGIVAWGVGTYIHHLIDQPWSQDLNTEDTGTVGGQPVWINDPLEGVTNALDNALQQTASDGWSLLKNTAAETWQGFDDGWHDLDNMWHGALNVFNPLSWG